MNWKDKINQLVEHVTGDINEISLEHRIFNLQCGLLVVVMVIIVVLNILLDLGTALIALTVFSMLVFATMYYLSRFQRKTDAIFWPYITLMTFIQCGAWFVNGGAESSNVITLMAMGIIFSVITRKDRRLALVLIYVATFTFLYVSEYFFPNLVTPYSTRLARFVDCYVSNLYSFIGLFSVIAIVMNNYHNVIHIVEQEKQQLLILTQRDTLTGSYNRSYMEAALDAADYVSRTSGKGYCLIVIDLDFFKHINDHFGHMGGDKVLIDFAAQISANIGPEDLLGRVGGEEFLILCYDRPAQTAAETAEILRHVISTSVIEYEGQQIHYTASFGVSCSNHTHLEGRELWKLADKALYVAKNKGKNRVEISPY